MSYREGFAARLRGRETLAGTFLKSRDPALVEVLGLAGFDFAILDAEHGAFDRSEVALMAMASRAAALPLLVRVPGHDAAWIATVLDAGCAGVMVPGVESAEEARALVNSMRYGVDGMGFSPSTPGAEYGTRGVAGHLAQQPKESVLICQIESEKGVAAAAEIAGVEGVDGLLLGPVDLAVSMGLSDPGAAQVVAHCERVVSAAAEAGTAGGLFLAQLSAAGTWQGAGATLFVLGSDQAFLLGAAREALGVVRGG